jgi:hypothetical protein
MFMIVRRPHGRVTGYPMTGIFRDGSIAITTYRKAAKTSYLLADDRVCCVVPDADAPSRGLALYGRATLADPSDFPDFLVTDSNPDAASTAAVVPAEVRAKVRDRLETQKRVAFRIELERIVEVGGADAAP